MQKNMKPLAPIFWAATRRFTQPKIYMNIITEDVTDIGVDLQHYHPAGGRAGGREGRRGGGRGRKGGRDGIGCLPRGRNVISIFIAEFYIDSYQIHTKFIKNRNEV